MPKLPMETLSARRSFLRRTDVATGMASNRSIPRNRSAAIEELFKLDRLVAGKENTQALASAPEPDASHNNPGPISIEQGWATYLNKKSIPIYLGGLKSSSIRKYKGHAKRFVTFCKKNDIMDWREVNQSVLEKHGTAQDGKLAPITIHDDLTMQISVSNWLIKTGYLPLSCKINWELIKPEGAEQYCYERDEVKRMLEFTNTFTRHRYMYPLIFLLSHTGMRISEAINMKWRDIDLKNQVIHVRDETNKKLLQGQERRQVKAKKSRIIPIHPNLLDCFMQQKKSIDSDYFLVGKNGRKRSYSHTREQFERVVIKQLSEEFPTPGGELGFSNGRFHSFRHFFVSECFAASIPECDIKDWVGHSSSKIIELYRHIRSETAKANMRLGKFGAE